MKITSHAFRMRSLLPTAVAVVMSPLLTSCGGGGGGEGGGENARTGIRLVQGAIDVAPLDLYDSGQLAATVRQAKFAAPSLYGGLAEGGHTVIATRANRPADRFTSQQVTVAEGDRFTLLTFGNTEGIGLRSRILKDAVPELGGQSGVRIVHGLSGAESIVASSPAIGASQSVSFGGDSGYKLVTPGPTRISFTRAVDGKNIGSVTLDALPDEAYSIFLLGEIDYFSAIRVAGDTD